MTIQDRMNFLPYRNYSRSVNAANFSADNNYSYSLFGGDGANDLIARSVYVNNKLNPNLVTITFNNFTTNQVPPYGEATFLVPNGNTLMTANALGGAASIEFYNIEKPESIFQRSDAPLTVIQATFGSIFSNVITNDLVNIDIAGTITKSTSGFIASNSITSDYPFISDGQTGFAAADGGTLTFSNPETFVLFDSSGTANFITDTASVRTAQTFTVGISPCHATQAQNKIYICDRVNKTLKRYTAAGALDATIVITSGGVAIHGIVGDTNNIYSFISDTAGTPATFHFNVYNINSGISTIDTALSFAPELVANAYAQFMGVRSDGSVIIFTIAGSGIGRILIISSTGALISNVALPAGAYSVLGMIGDILYYTTAAATIRYMDLTNVDSSTGIVAPIQGGGIMNGVLYIVNIAGNNITTKTYTATIAPVLIATKIITDANTPKNPVAFSWGNTSTIGYETTAGSYSLIFFNASGNYIDNITTVNGATGYDTITSRPAVFNTSLVVYWNNKNGIASAGLTRLFTNGLKQSVLGVYKGNSNIALTGNNNINQLYIGAQNFNYNASVPVGNKGIVTGNTAILGGLI